MQTVKGLLRSLDIYGHEVKLLYKGNSTKKTLPGALLTVISVGLLAWYLILQLSDIQNNKNSFKQTLIQLDLDNLQFPISKDSFDTALMLLPPFAFNKEQDKNENIYRYANITTILTITTDKLDQDGDRINEDQHLELFKCSKDRMFSSERYKAMIERYQYAEQLCFKQFEQLKFRTDNNRITYRIGACDQEYLSKKYPNSTCEKNKTKAQEILTNTNVIIFSSSFYFDPEEFNESPVKVNTVQNAFRFSQFEKIINYEIGYNKAIISDSKIHENIGNYQREFISTKFVSQGANDKSLTDPIHFTIQFYMTTEQNVFERQANNLVGALSNTGGLAGIVFAIVRILFGPMQEFLYYQSLLKKSYMVEKDRVLSDVFRRLSQFSYIRRNLLKENDKNLDISKFQAKDFNTYLELIKRLKNRVPFRYRFRQYLAYYVKRLFLCKRKHFRIQRELFDFGKKKIERQFDIAVILRDLRIFKMTNSLLLSKYQRKLIPFFKKYQLNQMYERDKQKKEKALKQGDQKLFVNEVTQLMVELFSDNQNPSNSYNQVFLHSLFLQNRENAQKDLKSLMYKAVLRYFININLEERKPSRLRSSAQKLVSVNVNPIARSTTLGASVTELNDIRLQLRLSKDEAQLSTVIKHDDSPKLSPNETPRDEENQFNTESNINQCQNEEQLQYEGTQTIDDFWEDAQVQETPSLEVKQQIK
ncbi:UNKNOWN [Stylonychia lemnae]|uniref:Transmembrane protein n=1 Tax=Stylonychia lemnae TaxID=5949 RepID=A0A078AB56_STYLE|nr:UNKNOWN [Stylonychia lemnae]|eukprot:CDW79116.1 UNKNOWN [Stylonychia lemnae]